MIEQLRRVILFGDVRPGERLVSSTWSKRLGVSQTPLREAFQRLAAEGFVLYDPQRGASVAPLTLRDAREIYRLRMLLEPQAVESSVRTAGDSWKIDLTVAFERVDALYSKPDAVPAGSIEAHRDFHSVLRSRCESTWLLRIAGMLADQSIRMQFASLVTRGGHGFARGEHRDLYDAAINGEAERSALLTADHLQRTLDALLLSDESISPTALPTAYV